MDIKKGGGRFGPWPRASHLKLEAGCSGAPTTQGMLGTAGSHQGLGERPAAVVPQSWAAAGNLGQKSPLWAEGILGGRCLTGGSGLPALHSPTFLRRNSDLVFPGPRWPALRQPEAPEQTDSDVSNTGKQMPRISFSSNTVAEGTEFQGSGSGRGVCAQRGACGWGVASGGVATSTSTSLQKAELPNIPQ